MNDLTHLTKDEANWILNDYNAIRKHSYVNDKMDKHAKFQSLIRNKEIKKPECGCENYTFQAISNSMFEQHYDAIKAIAG
jgi:hypothetical protein